MCNKTKRLTIILSSCLEGKNCKYNGGNNYNEELMELLRTNGVDVISVCPEKLGGLPIPRLPSEIKDGNGEDVLNGEAVVIDKNGKDVTKFFINGVMKANEIVFPERKKISFAILKARSPSCGTDKIYDGTFSGVLKDGNGVFAASLKSKGIEVYSEDEIDGIKENIKKIMNNT